MIPRYQRIAYWTLVGCIAIMAGVLIYSRMRSERRILAMRDQSPIPAPTDIPNEDASVALPNDADGTITLDQISLALPTEPSLRARVLLDRALTDLAAPTSTHPVPPGPAVTDVFLLPLPLRNPAAPADDTTPPAADSTNAPQLAVVNLTKSFADAHPSGIETEDLTIRTVVTTLQANFPQISQVRFLVDGQTRDTLAGHADLTRAYNVSDSMRVVKVQ